jgi:hypothetical protein
MTYVNSVLKRDSTSRLLTSGFSHKSISPKLLSTLPGSFQFFFKFAEILLTPVANGINI